MAFLGFTDFTWFFVTDYHYLVWFDVQLDTSNEEFHCKFNFHYLLKLRNSSVKLSQRNETFDFDLGANFFRWY